MRRDHLVQNEWTRRLNPRNRLNLVLNFIVIIEIPPLTDDQQMTVDSEDSLLERTLKPAGHRHHARQRHDPQEHAGDRDARDRRQKLRAPISQVAQPDKILVSHLGPDCWSTWARTSIVGPGDDTVQIRTVPTLSRQMLAHTSQRVTGVDPNSG